MLNPCFITFTYLKLHGFISFYVSLEAHDFYSALFYLTLGFAVVDTRFSCERIADESLFAFKYL